IVSVDDEQEIVSEFRLEQNYPNPFNPNTKIKFTIPNVIAIRQLPEKQSQLVTLKIYDILGNEIATLVNDELSPGEYEVEFNTSSIKHLPSSGIYFYTLKAGDFVQTKKMILLK
ncbi:MAG: T9SS type A sorting domain-containing protein, partial [Ignavibacteriaceae bacterium]|nr:T9SS type A sorting domain-containing protein [Ignavibacteriaceae bacterium]